MAAADRQRERVARGSFSRAAFLGAGGALVVSFGLPPASSAAETPAAGGRALPVPRPGATRHLDRGFA